MGLLWIVLALVIGFQCGVIVMGILQARRQEKLEFYEKQLIEYRKKLEEEFDFEFPESSTEKEYFYQKYIY